MGVYTKLASAIYNDIMSGLSGINSNPSLSIEQLEDDIVDENLALIKQYSLKNIIPKKDLLYSINCITVDCMSLDKCCLADLNDSKPVAHFEIPQIVNDFGGDSIEYLGSTDKTVQFQVYTSPTDLSYSKYKRRRKTAPYAYIDTTPNGNNMYDVFVFNAPMLEVVSIMAIFKDLRQLEQYTCCGDLEDIDNSSFINSALKKNLTERKLKYYRQLYATPQPNNQVTR